MSRAVEKLTEKSASQALACQEIAALMSDATVLVEPIASAVDEAKRASFVAVRAKEEFFGENVVVLLPADDLPGRFDLELEKPLFQFDALYLPCQLDRAVACEMLASDTVFLTAGLSGCAVQMDLSDPATAKAWHVNYLNDDGVIDEARVEAAVEKQVGSALFRDPMLQPGVVKADYLPDAQSGKASSGDYQATFLAVNDGFGWRAYCQAQDRAAGTHDLILGAARMSPRRMAAGPRWLQAASSSRAVVTPRMLEMTALTPRGEAASHASPGPGRR